jgi:type VI secretion system secreted protein Hcp
MLTKRVSEQRVLLPLGVKQKPNMRGNCHSMRRKFMKSAIRRGIMGRVVLLLVVIVIAMAPTAASAADQIFMLIPGIPGGSQATGRAGWIDVLAFSGGATAPATSTNPAPPMQPAPQPCQISVEKQLDIAGPRLWAATATGQTFNNIHIVVTASTGGSPLVIFDILLTNAQITSIRDSGSAGGGTPTETMTLKATNMSLTFTPQNPDGSAGMPVTTSFACN